MSSQCTSNQSLLNQPMHGQVLSAAEMQELAATLNRKFAAFIKDRYFEVETNLDFQGIYAKLTLRDKAGRFFYPVEGRTQHLPFVRSLREAGLLLLDYMIEYFEQYFESNCEVFLPIDYEVYGVEDFYFKLKGQIFNLEMERLADLWLDGKFEDVPDDLVRH